MNLRKVVHCLEIIVPTAVDWRAGKSHFPDKNHVCERVERVTCPEKLPSQKWKQSSNHFSGAFAVLLGSTTMDHRMSLGFVQCLWQGLHCWCSGLRSASPQVKMGRKHAADYNMETENEWKMRIWNKYQLYLDFQDSRWRFFEQLFSISIMPEI